MHLELPITSLGLVTALGQGVVHCAAAQRAGMSLTRELPDLSVEAEFEDDENNTATGRGHVVSPLTDGFLHVGRWMRLGLAALRDLVTYAELPPPTDAGFWRRTALIVLCPDTATDRFGWPEEDANAIIAMRYVERLLGLFGAELSFDRAHVFTGHASLGSAALAINGILSRGAVERAVVLGVDSYVDPMSLQILQGEGRLKTPMTPTGMLPGEAGACFLLERVGTATHRSGRQGAVFLAAAHLPPAREGPAEPEERMPFFYQVGRHLAAAATSVLEQAGVTRAFSGDVFVDLNGEEWKAHVWSAARLALGEVLNLDRASIIFPCASFGEIGAASGPAAVCLATRAFIRGYARGDKGLVLSVGDNGDVGAALVGRTNGAY